MYNTILVKFVGSDYDKEYAYFTELDLQKEDVCVVEVNGVYKTVEVTKTRGLSRLQIDKAHKWIVQKVDVQDYLDAADRRELVTEIRNKLRSYKDQAEEMVLYQELAKSNPEIKGLLEELKTIAPDMVPQIES